MSDKNTVALYVDKDLVNIYKASLDMYEALKKIASCDSVVAGDVIDIAQQALTKAENK